MHRSRRDSKYVLVRRDQLAQLVQEQLVDLVETFDGVPDDEGGWDENWMPRYLELLIEHHGNVSQACRALRVEEGPCRATVYAARSRCERFAWEWGLVEETISRARELAAEEVA